jgi:hypothetical protein
MPGLHPPGICGQLFAIEIHTMRSNGDIHCFVEAGTRPPSRARIVLNVIAATAMTTGGAADCGNGERNPSKHDAVRWAYQTSLLWISR